MKKKLLFILSSYSHGGTNKSLENVLSLMNNDFYEYYIFAANKDDIYKNIFSKYNIIDSPIFLQKYVTSQSIVFKMARYLDRTFFNFTLIKVLSSIFASRLEKNITFDKVIAFEEGIYLRLIASSFKARKYSWIHCDYKSYVEMFKPDLSKEYNLFSLFEKIICVSNTTKISFLNFFKTFEHKTDFIYNVLNSEKIIAAADDDKEIDNRYIEEVFTIVSVGRLHYIKQFDKIPNIVNELHKKNKNIKFKWYIIGDGDYNEKVKITKEIEKYQLQDKIICLGAKNNPYPYIKKANLLAVTSLSEAYPCVVNEAKILNTPVLSTNFDSVNEVIDENTGIITSIDNFPDILYNIINDNNMVYSNLKKNIINYKFNNDSSLNKLYQLL